MGFVSHRVERHEISAGDHIYTWSAAFAYSHHGIYIGEDKVIHYTQQENTTFETDSTPNFSSSKQSNLQTSFSSFSCPKQSTQITCPPDCGLQINKSGVVLSCLNCFLGEQKLYRFQYGVNTMIFIMKLRGGTCTTAKSDPPEDVIHRATYLHQHGFGNYDVLKNNCEDFALYCKTGLFSPYGGSGQVANARSMSFILSTSSRLLMSTPVGVVTTAVGYYHFSKYANDIGVRKDMVKVPVEQLKINDDDR